MHEIAIRDCKRSIQRLSVEIEIIAEELKKRLDENASSEFVLPLIDRLKEVISAKLSWEHRLAIVMLAELLLEDEESARID